MGVGIVGNVVRVGRVCRISLDICWSCLWRGNLSSMLTLAVLISVTWWLRVARCERACELVHPMYESICWWVRGPGLISTSPAMMRRSSVRVRRLRVWLLYLLLSSAWCLLCLLNL